MLLRRSPQRPSALPGSAVVLPRISSMRSPCPTQPCSQSSSTDDPSGVSRGRAFHRQEEAERVQFSSDGAQEGQVLGSRSSHRYVVLHRDYVTLFDNFLLVVLRYASSHDPIRTFSIKMCVTPKVMPQICEELLTLL